MAPLVVARCVCCRGAVAPSSLTFCVFLWLFRFVCFFVCLVVALCFVFCCFFKGCFRSVFLDFIYIVSI